MSTEAGTLYGEVRIHAPSDGEHIMIDCQPRLYRMVELAIQFAGQNLQVQRTDEAPVQIRRIVHADRFGPGLLGLHQPVAQVELEYIDDWRLWLPTDTANVADEHGVNKFAYLVGCYGARALQAQDTAGSV